MIVFVHIPKTGGTSIRMAAAEYFGEDAVLYDYGPAQKTSPIVRELKYELERPDDLARWIKDNQIAFLSGHFRYEQYAALLPDATFVTWVRDPVERIRSLYNHRTRHYDETSKLKDFVRKPRNCNKIAGLAGDPSNYAAIGVLERHAESIKMINAQLGIELAVRHDNQLGDAQPLGNKLRNEILRRNAEDQLFVEAADTRLDAALGN